MRFCYLDGQRMTDPLSAHSHLQKVLELPDYYGQNLDALYDCLTEIGSDTTICLTHPEAVRQNLGSYGDRLLATLREAEVDNPNLHVVFEHRDPSISTDHPFIV